MFVYTSTFLVNAGAFNKWQFPHIDDATHMCEFIYCIADMNLMNCRWDNAASMTTDRLLSYFRSSSKNLKELTTHEPGTDISHNSRISPVRMDDVTADWKSIQAR